MYSASLNRTLQSSAWQHSVVFFSGLYSNELGICVSSPEILSVIFHWLKSAFKKCQSFGCSGAGGAVARSSDRERQAKVTVLNNTR